MTLSRLPATLGAVALLALTAACQTSPEALKAADTLELCEDFALFESSAIRAELERRGALNARDEAALEDFTLREGMTHCGVLMVKSGALAVEPAAGGGTELLYHDRRTGFLDRTFVTVVDGRVTDITTD